MRTTLNISDELISESIKLCGITNKTRIIELALSNLIRKLKRDKIRNAYGKINLENNIESLRTLDKK